ncbi:hypothetical protein [Actinomadura nitritigenes]|uniref:hypothetical protein n=1 Tax=Actinomadura nitritigenes TaxID=134602 RepID=UPI003D8DB732
MPHQTRAAAGSPTEASPAPPMSFSLSGDVGTDQVERARAVFSRVLGHAHERRPRPSRGDGAAAAPFPS